MPVNFRAKKDFGLRTNERITASEVRVISSSGKQLGIISIREALNHAEDEGFDLVEVSPDSNPPVCKIIDYGKLRYREQKSKKEAKKKQKTIEVKEIKLRPVTETHDYQFKIKNAQKFISKGDKVKFTIRFKGRELQHSHLGEELMDKIKFDMQEVGKVELDPRFDGKQIIMVIQPL